ncbi:Uncharacterised protein [Mycobacteroides abscessus subsp. massiliense]|nr:Uncharacterised protein [Mycobacteroides abscessus subsp. massiliense]
MRLPTAAVRRISPASPTSPMNTMLAGNAMSVYAEATAIRMAKSDDGSVMRMPPTVAM